MITDENILGKNIKKLRAIKGISRKEMAEDLNTTYRTVSSWEIGEKKPRLNKLEEIANYLGVNASTLFKNEIPDDELLKSIKGEDPVERLARLLYEKYMSVPDKHKPRIEEELLKYANHLKMEIDKE
ncbi:helix-turn-helix transcriptional regulator [Bacillus thuringiensis]